MSSVEPLCQLVGIKNNKLSKEEKCIIEAELFLRICDEIINMIISQYKDYFYLIQSNEDKESSMLDAMLIRHIIKDILLTDEYSLEGIACYTQTPEEVICDVVIGKNSSPSLPLFRKILELHRLVRPNLYREIINKIISEGDPKQEKLKDYF